jgi:hypothetical protein
MRFGPCIWRALGPSCSPQVPRAWSLGRIVASSATAFAGEVTGESGRSRYAAPGAAYDGPLSPAQCAESEPENWWRCLTPFRFGLSEQRQVFAIDPCRRLAFFLCGTFRFADRHQEFGLLSRQFTPSGLPAAFPDRREILADFARQRDSFGRHWFVVTGLRWDIQAWK